METLRVHRYLPFTKVEGPGERACLWVQGCPIHCPGCAVPQTWTEQGGELIPVEEMARRVLAGPNVEGITFLGGEPFQQAAALAELARLLKAEGLSVMCFTGYLLENIQKANRPDFNALLAQVDLLIDGPFIQEQRDLSRPWVGSRNQRYHFFTERYKHVQEEIMQIKNRVEVLLHPDGRVQINGMATREDLLDLFPDLV